MRSWVLTVGLPLGLAVIGTLGLIDAWDHQNRELARATENVSRLQRSQLVIDNDEIARDQWLIALDQEISKPKPNEEFLTNAAQGAIEAFLLWQTHMKIRVAASPLEYQKELNTRDAMIAQAEEFAGAKDYGGLIAMLQKLAAMPQTRQLTAELDKEFFAEVSAADNRVADIESRMRFWYVFGTFLLLLSTLFANIFLDRTLRRMEEQIGFKHSRK